MSLHRPWIRPRAVTATATSLLLVVVIAVAGLLYHPAYLVLGPGPTADVSEDVSIEGTWSEENSGTYLLTTVSTWRPNTFGFLWARLQGRDVVPLAQVIPPGQTSEEYSSVQREVFRESRVLAAAAAARAAGMNVAVRGSGAVVEAILDDSPAQGVLRPGDVIVSVNGERIRLATDLQRVIGSRGPGTVVEITIQRDDGDREVTLETARLPEALVDARSGIGVAVSTRDFDLELPFEVTFNDTNIGGPSAGLAYALAITDMLQRRDYAEGTIGASGTIALTGEVGRVGGLPQKAVALQKAGAELFLLPQEQVDGLDAPPDLDLRGVQRLDEALALLGAELETTT